MMIATKTASRILFGAALFTVIATNAFVLSGVAANRSGSPEAQVTLTERELALSRWRFDENSGLGLHLSWRVLPHEDTANAYGRWETPAWLDEEKLAGLGFDLKGLKRAGDDRAYSKAAVPKAVFVVLEMDGAAYGEALGRAQREVDDAAGFEDEGDHEKGLERERLQNSRLFAVDAGSDPHALRARYGDRHRYLIAKGLVKPYYSNHEKRRGVFGRISKLNIERIHVPLELRHHFEGLSPHVDGDVHLPRYRVTLAYGKRFEPWIVAVAPLDEASIALEAIE